VSAEEAAVVAAAEKAVQHEALRMIEEFLTRDEDSLARYEARLRHPAFQSRQPRPRRGGAA
jgi:hypothetical protein